MKVVDANVLLYAVNERSAEHVVARRWLDGALAGSESVGFAWIVVLAFVRLATHPSVFPRPLSPEDAISAVHDWLAQPAAVVIEPPPRHIALLAGLLRSTGTAANLVNDAHLAALATEHGASIVSFDADFGRFDGLAWSRPS